MSAKHVIQKLKNRRGESIAEVLIALLVSALGMLLLATMISASAKVIQKSKEAMREYVRSENALVEQNSSNSYDTGSVSISSSDFNNKLWDGASSDFTVLYYVNSSASTGRPSISYRIR